MLRQFQRFQNQHASAFADDESVALSVKRTAGPVRLVIASRKRAHGGETADAHRSDRRFGAAGDHYFGVAALNYFEGVADAWAEAEQAVAVAEFGPLAP